LESRLVGIESVERDGHGRRKDMAVQEQGCWRFEDSSKEEVRNDGSAF